MNSVAVAILCVVSGGSLGALLRFTLAKNFDASASGFPFGTFAANMLASFLLELFSALANAEELSRTAEIFLDTGFCATLSTFSTLAWQIADMLKKKAAAALLATFHRHVFHGHGFIFARRRIGWLNTYKQGGIVLRLNRKIL